MPPNIICRVILRPRRMQLLYAPHYNRLQASHVRLILLLLLFFFFLMMRVHMKLLMNMLLKCIFVSHTLILERLSYTFSSSFFYLTSQKKKCRLLCSYVHSIKSTRTELLDTLSPSIAFHPALPKCKKFGKHELQAPQCVPFSTMLLIMNTCKKEGNILHTTLHLKAPVHKLHPSDLQNTRYTHTHTHLYA